jgi:hypothetical protein
MMHMGRTEFPGLRPEAAGTEALDHRERNVREQRQEQNLSAADVTPRLPHEQAIPGPAVRRSQRTLSGRQPHPLGDLHALGRSGGAGRIDQGENVIVGSVLGFNGRVGPVLRP